MARSTKVAGSDSRPPRQDAAQSRKANHIKNEVYRQMFLLESQRPGAEMGLALALLHAYVEAESLSHPGEIRNWLKTICPISLRMIEVSLKAASTCLPD